MKYRSLKLILAVVFAVSVVSLAEATEADFACDVVNVQGKVYVTSAQEERHEIKQGDLLKPGDRIEVEKDSYVDIAYDKEWDNLSRIKEDSQVAVRSVFPTALDMARGSVFSRLNNLPKNSSFQIQTPSAVATVRGTVFEASEHDGRMEVRNFSEGLESKVYVNILDALGNRSSEITVPVSEKLTGIVPQKMSHEEMTAGRSLTTDMTNMAAALGSGGHISNIQSVKDMEAYAAARVDLPGTDDDKKPGVGGPPNGPGSGPDAGGGPVDGVHNPAMFRHVPPPASGTFAPPAVKTFTPPIDGTFRPPVIPIPGDAAQAIARATASTTDAAQQRIQCILDKVNAGKTHEAAELEC